MSDFTTVTKEQLTDWLLVNPGLERDVCGIGDPPLVTYNDFSGGKVWPESILAAYRLGREGEELSGFCIRTTVLDSVWCSWRKK